MSHFSGLQFRMAIHIVFYGNQVNGTVLFLFFLAKINSENIIVLSHMVAHKSETFDHFTSDQIDWQIFFYEFIAKPNKYSHACVQHSKWLN